MDFGAGSDPLAALTWTGPQGNINLLCCFVDADLHYYKETNYKELGLYMHTGCLS